MHNKKSTHTEEAKAAGNKSLPRILRKPADIQTLYQQNTRITV